MTRVAHATAVDAAVNWWQERIASPPIHDNGDAFQSVFSTLVASRAATPNPEQIATFGVALHRLLEEGIDIPPTPWGVSHLSGLRDGVGTLSVDYDPDRFLATAAEEAGIDDMRFPIKTVMWISPDRVTVRCGYGANVQTIWPA